MSKISPEELIKSAKEVKQHAYSPYSKFKVGAALETESGDIIVGCNVENASYSVTICAERSAICSAVSKGHKKIVAVAVIGDKRKKLTPCGICRQALREFGEHMTVYCANVNEEYDTYQLSDLLVSSFGPDDLTSE